MEIDDFAAAMFALGLASSPAIGATALKALDTDNDGTIDFAEAKAAASKVFDKLERDKDGTLDKKELQGRISKKDWAAADPDKDGTLTEDEYLAAVDAPTRMMMGRSIRKSSPLRTDKRCSGSRGRFAERPSDRIGTQAGKSDVLDSKSPYFGMARMLRTAKRCGDTTALLRSSFSPRHRSPSARRSRLGADRRRRQREFAWC